jgi:hypothetical protein
MTFDEKEVLGRFHRALVREIQAKSPEHISSPFTVAEIYQNLVPYRTHRDEIGVEMNADYEYALLRLLAGEGDFLSIESRTARKEIREELDSPNPNTGLYRDFAAADVRLNPDVLDETLMEEISQEVAAAILTDDESMEVEVMEEEGMGEGFGAEDASKEEFERLEVEPLGANLEPLDETEETEEKLDSEEPPAEVSDETNELESEDSVLTDPKGGGEMADLTPFENCPWCRETLPEDAEVRFCPFCGSNVQRIPCPACGEELRLNWRFCIACGTEVES